MFQDVLLTVDYDRTLTGPDSTVPQRNLDAIRYFMENGGAFTVNTGRSGASYRPLMDVIPVSAPLLLFNGGAALENGQWLYLHCIELPVWETLDQVAREFPEMNLEVQGLSCHFLVDPTSEYLSLYKSLGWHHSAVSSGDDVGPFVKFALYGKPHYNAVSTMFSGTAEEIAEFDRAEARIRELWGDKVTITRSAPRIIDVQAKGVSKSVAARELQKRLRRKLLVCVGDAENDVSMLDGADFAFCPADAAVADRYETVCPCADGAVADVIYEKIPEILKTLLDRTR